MWPGLLICLMLGMLVGYLYAKIIFHKNDEKEIEKKIAVLTYELADTRQLLQQLQQENADLKYQLGEQKKSRAYAEQNTDKENNDHSR
jgi:uncharacterized membrane-anchored protein YhcB (DUF1043 family)